MSINEVQEPDKKQLLNIQLPTPTDNNPRSPLSIGQHNAAAIHNFQKVADIMMALINNQKMLSEVVNNQNEEIKNLKKANEEIAKNIRELLNENKKNDTK